MAPLQIKATSLMAYLVLHLEGALLQEIPSNPDWDKEKVTKD